VAGKGFHQEELVFVEVVEPFEVEALLAFLGRLLLLVLLLPLVVIRDCGLQAQVLRRTPEVEKTHPSSQRELQTIVVPGKTAALFIARQDHGELDGRRRRMGA
jgi:hypothetical protein